jgi:uncharacterized protein (TIGR03067 family)
VILANYGGAAPPVMQRVRELVAALRRGAGGNNGAVTASAGTVTAHAQPGEAASLEGSWLAVSEKLSGGETGEDFSRHRIIFNGSRFTVKNGEKVLMSGTWKADADSKPATLDLTVTEGGGDEHKGETARGVFEVAGDKLRWCTAEPGVAERPKGFETEGTTYMVVEFEREKIK